MTLCKVHSRKSIWYPVLSMSVVRFPAVSCIIQLLWVCVRLCWHIASRMWCIPRWLLGRGTIKCGWHTSLFCMVGVTKCWLQIWKPCITANLIKLINLKYDTCTLYLKILLALPHFKCISVNSNGYQSRHSVSIKTSLDILCNIIQSTSQDIRAWFL